VLLIIRLILELVAIDPNAPDAATKPGVAGVLVSKLTSHINLIVVLIVVSIPEGLPLTIGVSLAFTVMRMYNENILVRKLDAPEKMGQVEEILVGKTSTITKSDMKVMQFFCEDKPIKVSRPDTLIHCEVSDDAKTRIKECILYNCDARIEMDATTYVPVGNGTEVGLLKFLQNADIPVHLLIQKKLDKIRMIIPFSSEKKRSIVALDCPDRKGRVCVYLKGAPEQILLNCGAMMAGDRRLADIDGTERHRITTQISKMAAEPLRVIGLAYMEMDEEEWIHQFESGPKSAAINLEGAMDSGNQLFTWIGAFAMKDQLRPNVAKCVKYARERGELSIRLVSGDHVETAKAVAIKAGILRQEESGRNFAVMTGAEFRRYVGGLTHQNGEISGVEQTLENMGQFQEIAEHIRVLARATPTDRLMLVTGLKAIGRSVAVTGSGINDVESLQAADVGLAMGSGCSAAKEAADLVLTDNDFEATLRSIMWGRNIYHNVSRFLQF
jgi:Ca2+ transporting ATPase